MTTSSRMSRPPGDGCSQHLIGLAARAAGPLRDALTSAARAPWHAVHHLRNQHHDSEPMTTTEIYLIAMAIIFTVPYLIWRVGNTDYYAPLVVVQILAGIVRP